MTTTWIVYIYLNVRTSILPLKHIKFLYIHGCSVSGLSVLCYWSICLSDSQLGSDFAPTPPPHIHTRHLVISKYLETFLAVTKRGRGVLMGMSWVQDKDAAENPVIHRTATPTPKHPPPKNYSVQNINSIPAENPQSIPMVLKLQLLYCFFS